MIGFSIFFWFWQSMATPTPTPLPETASNLSFYLVIAVTALLSFIFGVLVTAVFFLAKNGVIKQNSTATQFTREVESPKTSIKQCPKCHSTYTDEDLTYCLRDGLTLKIVGSMPIPPVSDKTSQF